MFPPFTSRPSRRQIVLEFNPQQVLAAEISQPRRGRVVLETTVEFARDDEAALSQWLETRPWTRVITGLVPKRGIVQRESLDPRQMSEPDYLANTVEEQQKGQFLSATPFKVVNPEAWTFRAVDAVEGTRLNGGPPGQAAVICGLANEEIQDVQQRLHDERVIPERIESGLLSLFGAMAQHVARRGDNRAVAIVVVHPFASMVYIVGKEGVHTPTPILHGFNSIVEVAKKELGVKDEAEVRRMLHASDLLVMQRADRLVRRVGRDLKPVLDSYEMTTGHPLDEIFCAYLPPNLMWLGDALASVTGRVPATLYCAEWMPTVGLHFAQDGATLGTHWLGALSLIANLPPPTRLKREGRNGEDDTYHRSWHVDYKLPAISAERIAASRRFLTGAIAVALLAFAVALTSWQLYANGSLRDDLDYWERQMTTNRRLFDELTASNSRLQAQSASLGQAYELMAAPYTLSDFILNLGRTVPPHMRIDRIEANDQRATISGVMFEPAEEATGTLGTYMDGLRRNPAIGPLFSSIGITSLQRKSEGDTVVFEITLRGKEAAP